MENENKILVFSSYEKSLADTIFALLTGRGVECYLSNARSNIEAAYGASNSNTYNISVNKEDEQTALEIIELINNPSNIDDNIDSFSDNEIIEIILNPDEWHESFVEKAIKISEKRNLSTYDKDISESQNTKISKYEQGKQASIGLRAFSWIFAIVGGLFGIFGGYGMWMGKTTAINGKKYYYYNSKTRTEGKVILIVSLFSIAIQVFLILNYY